MSRIPLMVTGNPLASPLKTLSTKDLERVVINTIWDTHWTTLDYNNHKHAYSAYFHHIYQNLCKAACSGDAQIPDYTHEQILQLICLLKKEAKTKLEISAIIPLVFGSTPSQSERAVNLAAALLIPLNFSGVGGARPGEMTTWRPNESLKGLVDGKAKIWSSLSAPTNTPCTTCTTCTSTTKFPRSFSAWHLKFLAGFSIVWTNNLSDHLLVLDNEAEVTVYIFHQVKLLELHQNMPLNIIPPDLILETFDTLALLFPRTSQRNRTWYSNLEELYGLDPGAFRCPYLTLEDHEIHHFRYWGARLANLKRAFDEHEPTGPIQWWRDDRKRVQWYTFWVAILVLVLTILFGLIQSVAAILQVIKS